MANTDDEFELSSHSENPLTAASNPFSGGNSRAARRERARRQPRDSKGRFIRMGGGAFGTFRRSNGKFSRFIGKSIGASDRVPNGIQIYIKDDPSGLADGFYTLPADKTTSSVGILTGEQLKDSGVDVPTDSGSAEANVIDFKDVFFSDAPEGWEKQEDGSLRTIEDDIAIIPTEDGKFELTEDGESIDTFDSVLDAVITANKRELESDLTPENRAKVAELREAGDEEGAEKILYGESEEAEAPKSKAVGKSGDEVIGAIQNTVAEQAKATGDLPIIQSAADVENAVGGQYKSLFDEFKSSNPELAEQFSNADEYWDYLKNRGVSINSPWVNVADIDPILKESNKLYAKNILGLPEDGFIELYRNATNGQDSEELSAAGYASLDKKMAWDYRSANPQKQSDFNGQYVINVKPEEVNGVLGYSQAADEFAVTISPEVTSIPGRVQRVGDLEVQPVTSYIDDTETFDRTAGASPHRFFSLASQYNFSPISQEALPGESWKDFTSAYDVPQGGFKSKFEELFGEGSFEKMREAAGRQPQYSFLKDMFIELPDGTQGFDPRVLESERYGTTQDQANYDFALKLLTTAQEFLPEKFMTPRGSDSGAEPVAFIEGVPAEGPVTPLPPEEPLTSEQRRNLPGRSKRDTGPKFVRNDEKAEPATPTRIPDSLGESVESKDEDKLAMAISPITSAHLDENGEFTPERKALHEQIINSVLEGVTPVDNPIMWMNGGGPGSGKSTLTTGVNAEITNYDPNSVVLDPDKIKEMLPEVQEAKERVLAGEGSEQDIDWANLSHEESSYLAKRVHQAALDRGVNLVFDGTGDGGLESVRAKIAEARSRGYGVQANYLAVLPETGLERALQREGKTTRRVPRAVIIKTYNNIGEIFPELVEAGDFDMVRLFDNNGPQGTQAELILEASDGNINVLDQEAYDRFRTARISTEGTGDELVDVENWAGDALVDEEDASRDKTPNTVESLTRRIAQLNGRASAIEERGGDASEIDKEIEKLEQELQALLDAEEEESGGEPEVTEEVSVDEPASEPDNTPAVEGPRQTLTPLATNNLDAPTIDDYDTNPYVLGAENLAEGTTDDPKALANIFDPIVLGEAFKQAVNSGEGTISLEFPNGAVANIRVEAIRDTLQYQGIDTNSYLTPTVDDPDVADDVANPDGNEIGSPEAWRDGIRPGSYDELANAYNNLSNFEAELAYVTAADPDNDRRINNLKRRIKALSGRIERLRALGLRNIFDIERATPGTLGWDISKPDVVNPELVVDAINDHFSGLENFNQANGMVNGPEVMPNGDLKIGERSYEANGKRFTYEVFVTKTDDETFYAFIRETNHAETDLTKKYRSVRMGTMRQSAKATIKQAQESLDKLNNVAKNSNIISWFKNYQRAQRIEAGTIPKFDLVDADGNPQHIKDRVMTRQAMDNIRAATNVEDITDELINVAYNMIAQLGNSNEVLYELNRHAGFDIDTLNRFVDAINTNLHVRDKLEKYKLWESSNGTPLVDGDIVEYTGDLNQTGFGSMTGNKYVVKTRLLEHTVNGYTYTDYVHVRMLDADGNETGDTYLVASAHNLTLLNTKGGTDGSERVGPNAISIPLPTLTTRAGNRYATRDRLRDVAPYVSEYDRDSLANPTITIDGKQYPVQASRATTITSSLNSFGANVSQLQVGDFIPQLDVNTKTMRLSEIVGIDENEDGSRTVHTVLPIDLGSAEVASTTYPSDFDVVFDIYREDRENVVPVDMEGSLTYSHIGRLAGALRGVNTDDLDPETLARIGEILGAPDPSKLPYTRAQFADILQEVLEAQRGSTGTVTIQDATDVIQAAIRRGSSDQTTRNNLARARDSALARGFELDDDVATANIVNPPAPVPVLPGPSSRTVGNASVVGGTIPDQEWFENAVPGDQVVLLDYSGVAGRDSIVTLQEDGSWSDSSGVWGSTEDFVNEQLEGNFARTRIFSSSQRTNATSIEELTEAPNEGDAPEDEWLQNAGEGSTLNYTREDGSVEVITRSADGTWSGDQGDEYTTEELSALREMGPEVGESLVVGDTSIPSAQGVSQREFATSEWVRNAQDGDVLLRNFGGSYRILKARQTSSGIEWVDQNTGTPPMSSDALANFIDGMTPEDGGYEIAGPDFYIWSPREDGTLVSDPQWVKEAPFGTIVSYYSDTDRSLITAEKLYDGTWEVLDSESNVIDNVSSEQLWVDSNPEIYAGFRGDTEERDVDENQDTVEGDLPYSEIAVGPYTAEDGASTVSYDELRAAIASRDIETVKKVIMGAFANKRFGSKFRFSNFIVNTTVNGTGIYFEADITDENGEVVGGVTRQLNLNPNAMSADHLSLGITSDANKRTGFAKEFKRLSDDFYRSLGLQRIHISAVADGRVVWARMNYTWMGTEGASIMADRVQNAAIQARNNGLDRDAEMLQALADRFQLDFNDADFPDPIDLAYVVSEDGTDLGPILMGSAWNGVRYLDPAVDRRPKNRQDKKPEDYKPKKADEGSPLVDEENKAELAGDGVPFNPQYIQDNGDTSYYMYEPYPPAKTYHVAPKSAREDILANGLDAKDQTWNTGVGVSGNEVFRDEHLWAKDDEGNEYAYEYRPTGVYMFTDLDTAKRYAGDDGDIYEIDVESNNREIIRDPSVAMNWDSVEDEDKAYVTRYVQPDSLKLLDSENLVDEENKASITGDNRIDADGTVLDKSYFTNAEDGEIIVLDRKTSKNVYIRENGQWIEISHGLGNREPKDYDIAPDNSDMFETYDSTSDTQLYTIKKVIDSSEYEKYNDFYKGFVEEVELDRQGIIDAFTNNDKFTLDSMFINDLFKNGEQNFGPYRGENFGSYFATNYNGKSYYFWGDLVDENGKFQGTVERKLKIDDDGNIRIEHSLLQMQETAKGTGFGTQFSNASEELYTRLGIDYITLTAAWDGSYVWARAGYFWDFKNYDKVTALGDITDALLNALKEAQRLGNKQDETAMRNFIQDLISLETDDPNYPSPYDIATYQSETGDPDYMRNIMSYTDWHGIKMLGEYGRTGEQYVADQENEASGPSPADVARASQPTAEVEAPEFDGWEFIETREASEDATRAATERIVSRAIQNAQTSGVEPTEEQIAQLRAQWYRKYLAQYQDIFIYRKGNLTIEIDKSEIENEDVQKLINTLNQLDERYKPISSRERLIRFNGGSKPDGYGTYGDYSPYYAFGEDLDVINLWAPGITNIPGRGVDDLSPAARELFDNTNIVSYIIAHEYGHMLDYSNVSFEGEIVDVPREQRQFDVLSTKFREYVESRNPELWNNVSGYASSYEDVDAFTGIINITNTYNLETFAEAFAQMASEDIHGATPTEIGTIMRDFLREQGLIQ